MIPSKIVLCETYPRIKLTRDGVRRKFGVGDVVSIFNGSEKPYVARLLELGHDSKRTFFSTMQWFYYPEDIPAALLPADTAPNELFLAYHRDTNRAESILDTLRVEFCSGKGSFVNRLYEDSTEMTADALKPAYLCRREYDPAAKTVRDLSLLTFTTIRESKIITARKSKKKVKKPFPEETEELLMSQKEERSLGQEKATASGPRKIERIEDVRKDIPTSGKPHSERSKTLRSSSPKSSATPQASENSQIGSEDSLKRSDSFPTWQEKDGTSKQSKGRMQSSQVQTSKIVEETQSVPDDDEIAAHEGMLENQELETRNQADRASSVLTVRNDEESSETRMPNVIPVVNRSSSAATVLEDSTHMTEEEHRSASVATVLEESSDDPKGETMLSGYPTAPMQRSDLPALATLTQGKRSNVSDAGVKDGSVRASDLETRKTVRDQNNEPSPRVQTTSLKEPVTPVRASAFLAVKSAPNSASRLMSPAVAQASHPRRVSPEEMDEFDFAREMTSNKSDILGGVENPAEKGKSPESAKRVGKSSASHIEKGISISKVSKAPPSMALHKESATPTPVPTSRMYAEAAWDKPTRPSTISIQMAMAQNRPLKVDVLENLRASADVIRIKGRTATSSESVPTHKLQIPIAPTTNHSPPNGLIVLDSDDEDTVRTLERRRSGASSTSTVMRQVEENDDESGEGEDIRPSSKRMRVLDQTRRTLGGDIPFHRLIRLDIVQCEKGDLVFVRPSATSKLATLGRCLDRARGHLLTVAAFDASWPRLPGNKTSFETPDAAFCMQVQECFGWAKDELNLSFPHAMNEDRVETLWINVLWLLNRGLDVPERLWGEVDLAVMPGASPISPCAHCHENSGSVRVCRLFYACAQTVCEGCLARMQPFGKRGMRGKKDRNELVSGVTWTRLDFRSRWRSQWMCKVCCDALLVKAAAGEGLEPDLKLLKKQGRPRNKAPPLVISDNSNHQALIPRSGPPFRQSDRAQEEDGADEFIAAVLRLHSDKEMSAEEALECIRGRWESEQAKARQGAQRVLAKLL